MITLSRSHDHQPPAASNSPVAPSTKPIELRSGSSHRRWLPSVLLLTVVFVARAAYGMVARMPRVMFDEPSQLAVARLLSGRGHWLMAHAPTYQPGLGTMLAPINFFTADAGVVYRAALLLNALFAAMSALVLVRIARSLRVLPGAGAYVAASLIALAPATTPLSASAWSDPAVTLSFLAATLFLLNSSTDCAWRWPVAAVGAAVVGYLFHSRMLPAIGGVMVIASIEALRRRQWRLLTVLWMLSLAGTFAVRAYSSWLVSELWHGPSGTNGIGTMVRHLGDPRGIARAALGQAWYQAVSWLGLPVTGAVAVGHALRRMTGRSGILRSHAVVIGVMTASMGLTSVVFMAGRDERGDFLVYGRYNDDVVWPLLVVGAGTIWARRHGRPADLARLCLVPLGVTLALTLAVELWLGPAVRGARATYLMVSGLTAFTGYSALQPARIGLMAVMLIVALCGVLVLQPYGRPLAVCLLIALCVVGNARTLLPRSDAERRAATYVSITEVSDVIPEGKDLGFRLSYNGFFVDPTFVSILAQSYQFHLPETQFVLVSDSGQPPEYTLSVPDDPHLAERATIVWSHPDVHHVLWQLDPA